jgi:hypothetical protein
MSAADAQERDPVFTGLVYLKLAKLQREKGDPESLRLARDNASAASSAFRSTNGLGVRSEDMRAAEEIRAQMEQTLAQNPDPAMRR